MPLLERIGTLLRANLNDLIDRAEDPEKLCRQLVLDMENQLMQVKTQVAMAIADQHLLTKKHKEHSDAVIEWHRKAEVAVEKQKDDLARVALERSLENEKMAKGFAQQIEDQTAETELLRSAYSRLERKLAETRSACEMLIAQNRRARATGKANATRGAGVLGQRGSAVARLKESVQQQQAMNAASHMLLETGSAEDRLDALERDERIERLLAELKERQPRLT
ncbi:PspA/IM30 family protein [Edaphobacter flagellatus]|uniref:PspA/IM30 family protein n=1 Tax=Edaphobacter flagellatus TaxID=1933044 RepID=UPI0021B18DCA|nr:PspA/IM30 family protein [Edaphobacter flagellatus]